MQHKKYPFSLEDTQPCDQRMSLPAEICMLFACPLCKCFLLCPSSSVKTIETISQSAESTFPMHCVPGPFFIVPPFVFIFVTAESSKPGVEVPASTTGNRVQPRLGDVTVSEITPDSLLLSWSIQEGSFESFLIQYKDASDKLQVLPVDGAMRSLHLYNLTPSQRYKFNIYGVSGYKRIGPIVIDAVTGQQRFGWASGWPSIGPHHVFKLENQDSPL